MKISTQALLIVANLAASAGIRAAEESGAITGRVVDPQGKPLAGAQVWAVTRVKLTMERVVSARSDADGRFRLADLPDPYPVTVWAEAEGLARERCEDVRVVAGRDRDIGLLRLVPGTRMTGRIVDVNGEPIAGATAKLNLYRHVLGHTINSSQTDWTVTADAGGHFETVPLPAGEAAFTWGAPGKVRTRSGRLAVPGTDRMDLGDITLPEEVPIRGRIVDQHGGPAPGVEVFADYDYDNMVQTDAEGRFTLGGVGPKAETLMLQSNDYFAPKPLPIGDPRDDLRLTVQKAYTIDGTAVDAETGERVPLESVRLCIVERETDGTVVLRG